MIQHDDAKDLNKIKTLTNAVKNDKERIDELCKEFDMLNPKSHKIKFAE